MLGVLAALTAIHQQGEGRDALHYENYIRTGQGSPSTKIYRESSANRRARKDLAAVRYTERIREQIKFVRLMKKLLIKIDQETARDEEVEQMRTKVTELEVKVEKSARARNLPCEHMLDLDRPDDADDIELEQIIRNATMSPPLSKASREECQYDHKASGDHSTPVRDSNAYVHGKEKPIAFGGL